MNAEALADPARHGRRRRARVARLSQGLLLRVSGGGTRDRMPIVLAYDHRLLHEALRALLEAEPDLRIIGECGDGREVVQAVKRLVPQVLVVRLMMPGLSGLEVTRQVRDQVPTTSVVIVSMYASELYAAQGLRHGATGVRRRDGGTGKTPGEGGSSGRVGPPVSQSTV